VRTSRRWLAASSSAYPNLRWAKRQPTGLTTNKKSPRSELRGLSVLNNPGDTYFHAFGTIIGSQCLTTVFEMGTGVSTAMWSPGSDANGDKTVCALNKVVRVDGIQER
jgi:hypothetical protein